MQAYRKWILSLGIAAVTPGIALAGPFSFFKSASDAQESPITSNQQMAEAVAAQLRKAKFSGFDIEIEVKSGVCRLGGKVTSESDRKLADSLARKVKGVRVIDNQLEVVDRETVRQQIETAQAAPTPTAAPVQTRTAAPVIAESPFQSSPIGSPKAPTLPQAAAAPVAAPSAVQQAAATAHGGAEQPVEQVGFFGRGKQQPAASRGPSDQDIANQVALAVSRSGLRGHDISLTVRNGIATMSGQASSAQDVAALTQIVSQVSGVKQVDNQLAAPGQPRQAAPVTGNQAVAQQIANALAANQLSGLDIEVRYNNGTAVLSGLVPHPVPAQIAEQVAYSVQGVERVENRLQVSGPPPGMQGPQGPRGPIQQVGYQQQGGPVQQMAYQQGPPMMAPQMAHGGRGASQMAYDMPNLPEHAWPSYASYPNYAALSYPTEYSASAWPYIGPFYPYPQVPLGWRQVQLEWDDGNWNLNFRPRTERWYWWADPKNW